MTARERILAEIRRRQGRGGPVSPTERERIETYLRRHPRGPLRKPVENPGFTCVGELVYCARFKPEDARIQALMEMGTGESGGLAIPDDINPTMKEVAPQEAIMRPRATVVPAGESPDADLVLPSLNQGSGGNLYGGVEVDWIGEGVEKPETQPKLKETEDYVTGRFG